MQVAASGCSGSLCCPSAHDMMARMYQTPLFWDASYIFNNPSDEMPEAEAGREHEPQQTTLPQANDCNESLVKCSSRALAIPPNKP